MVDVFVNVTPRFAPASVQKYSSFVSSWKRMSRGLESGSPLIVPVPCTQVNPYAPLSVMVAVAPGSTVSSFAVKYSKPFILP